MMPPATHATQIITLFLTAVFLMGDQNVFGQSFMLGVDLSYVNEMEDCGVEYYEQGVAKDVYRIFNDHGARMVRLRLWHTPSWYDTLNTGKRYSDIQDVEQSIRRAKSLGMQVLLDFQLSDFWADPSRQWAPAAWAGAVNNLPVLQDSLRQYISQILGRLAAVELLPEVIQIGNETNRDILQATGVNTPWQLDWSRNAALFNTAIQAIRASHPQIKIALHIAGPQNVEWYIDGFTSHGVQDFDIIGFSYYWPYHQPATISETGDLIRRLRLHYPEKEVMILETGCIWTVQAADQAANVLNTVDPAYAPASPANQSKWLIDLTKTVYAAGGSGIIYWEPAWVSSPCSTPWGQGSHYENAAFFDFNHELIENGGIQWLEYDYTGSTGRKSERTPTVTINRRYQLLEIQSAEKLLDPDWRYMIVGLNGRVLQSGYLREWEGDDVIRYLTLPPSGYRWTVLSIWSEHGVFRTNPYWIHP